MPDNRLFIYYIKDIYRENEEYYVMAWFGETGPAPPSFQEAEISYNIFNLRRDVLEQLRKLTDNFMTVDLLREKVGVKLRTQLGLNEFFENVRKYAGTEISIRTNDVQIPWEWVYFEEEGKFLCELFPYGKVFLEKIKLVSAPQERPASLSKRIEEQLKESVVLVLHDKGGNGKLRSLPFVEEEVENLQIVFREAGIPEKNILTIDGSEKDAESNFMDIITKRRENLRIIHYAGHIMEDSLFMTSGKIECKEIEDVTAHKRMKGPLVFLNGCFSANILEEWEQEKNLSTSFLISGASGCVCTRRFIGDKAASNFSRKFYEKLLSKDEDVPTTIGSVLQIARQEFKKNCPPGDVNWLLYTLHGNPSYELFPRFEPKDLARQAPRKEFINIISESTLSKKSAGKIKKFTV